NAVASAVAGSTVNVAELLGAGNKGTYTQSIVCSNGGNITVTNGNFTMPATAVTCTITNTGTTAEITLTKAWVNAVAGDTANPLAISGPQVTGAVNGSSTAPNTTTPATATAVSGSTVTLAETLGGGNQGTYSTALACTTNNGQTVVTVTNNTI